MCVSGRISGLDHVQLVMPPGGEERARSYFGGLLGLVELEKPAELARSGGVWFGLPDGRQLHLGVEEPFRAAGKAHPAFACAVLEDLALRLGEGGYAVLWDGRWRRESDSTVWTLLEIGSSLSGRSVPWRDIMLLAS